MAVHRTVKGVMRGLVEASEIVITKVTLDLTSNLIETNPVKTGWSRANWVPSIGSPKLIGSGISKADSSQVSSARSAQQVGQSYLASAGYKLGQGRLFVSNGVPYIELLNSGSSKQAPSGFVQRSIIKAVTQDIRVIEK